MDTKETTFRQGADLPVEALNAVAAVPYDPGTEFLGHRWDAIDALLEWLSENGWRLIPPTDDPLTDCAAGRAYIDSVIDGVVQEHLADGLHAEPAIFVGIEAVRTALLDGVTP